jgi:hypothetical protein
VVVVLTQTKLIDVDGVKRKFRGGSSLVVDLTIPEVKYRIIKNIRSDNRERRTLEFMRDAAADPLRALLLAPSEPFAALHSLAEDGV